MELLLLRHGKAEDFSASGDAARELTAKGRERTRLMAQVARRIDCLPDLVLTSPRVRARQTAEVFCESAGIDGPVTESWLNCGMHAEEAMRELVAYHQMQRVMIVGHEPDFSTMVESLLGAGAGRIEFKKGALACLEVRPPAVVGVLQFLIPPRVSCIAGNG